MTIINFMSNDDADSWLWHHDYAMVADSELAITYESPHGVRAVMSKAENHKVELIPINQKVRA